MNIGNQIKALRMRKGVTQEAVAQHFHISAQAVSKWECGQSVPDIGMLPGLSAYFGVTIDELFALSDETRIERIQNMIWDMRFLNPADVENERQFLLEKARREPKTVIPIVCWRSWSCIWQRSILSVLRNTLWRYSSVKMEWPWAAIIWAEPWVVSVWIPDTTPIMH